MSDAPATIWVKTRGIPKIYTQPCADMPLLEKYRRADLPPTPEQIAADPRVQALVDALEEISRQKKTDELVTEYDVLGADFEGGYDACIRTARTALAEFTTTKPRKETT